MSTNLPTSPNLANVRKLFNAADFSPATIGHETPDQQEAWRTWFKFRVPLARKTPQHKPAPPVAPLPPTVELRVPLFAAAAIVHVTPPKLSDIVRAPDGKRWQITARPDLGLFASRAAARVKVRSLSHAK